MYQAFHIYNTTVEHTRCFKHFLFALKNNTSPLPDDHLNYNMQEQ